MIYLNHHDDVDLESVLGEVEGGELGEVAEA